jgi:N-acetylglutamate synthase-like GNAT family acetyltransferase
LDIVVRRAIASDAAALSALAFRSKASWGYDEAFMNRSRHALLVSAEYVQEHPVYVLLRDGAVAGFFGFISAPEETILNDFWIEPACIGTGLGRVMWQQAIEQARTHGIESFFIHSDPNAEGFYLHMGAERIGTRIAPETGRDLPLLQYIL